MPETTMPNALRNAALKVGFDTPSSENLPIEGQGTVSVQIKNNDKPFKVIFYSDKPDISQEVQIHVHPGCVSFFEVSGSDSKMVAEKTGTVIGLDQDKEAVYWFSIFGQNRTVNYGKGEMRKLTELAHYTFEDDSEKEDEKDSEKPSRFWMQSLNKVRIEDTEINKDHSNIWRDPVTIDPALLVVANDQYSMMDAAWSRTTVVENLSAACQKLYANVAGHHFTLNTPDFPDFTDAIENSIRNENGWCYQTLLKKKDEFGESDDTNGTYIRITLGQNQGWSPGVPFVLEIWPHQHYSPIHNHAGANAIIKVLHGEITVKLFSMLSEHHKKPFAQKTFLPGQTTWITPEINQTHQLINDSAEDKTCMTIQCYAYGKDNDTHYEYFDFLDTEGNIGHFDPVSDMGFTEFKELMRQEWQGMMRSKNWPEPEID